MAGALIELLAHVLAGGSINARFVPAISVGRRVDHDTIVSVFEAVGVDAQQRHADSDGRATEVYPTTDASVLGRCLVAMGAPQGTKTISMLSRQSWGEPLPIRRRFVEKLRRTPRGPLRNESNDAYPGGTPGVVSRRSPRPDRRVRYQHCLARPPWTHDFCRCCSRTRVVTRSTTSQQILLLKILLPHSYVLDIFEYADTSIDSIANVDRQRSADTLVPSVLRSKWNLTRSESTTARRHTRTE